MTARLTHDFHALHYNNPLELLVLKTLKDGGVHHAEELATAHYGEWTGSRIVSVRLAISQLRKQGYVINAAKIKGSNRKRGWYMADVAANWERGFHGRSEAGA